MIVSLFRTMDGNRAQEIREAYYKAEGLMTVARELELADADLPECHEVLRIESFPF